MAEMNMVPFIDVMLVLLIIFMVSAPLIATGLVDLPTVGKTAQRPPDTVIEVIVGTDEKVRLRVDRGDPQWTTLEQLASRVKAAQGGNALAPVVISADRNVKYEAVIRAMDRLQRAGIQRVGLVVKQGT